MIFWHIPKTGGRWVEEALSSCWGDARMYRLKMPPQKRPVEFTGDYGALFCGDHAVPSQVAEELKTGKFHFCFVRKPLAWYKSWWAYRVRRRRGSKSKYYCDRFYSEDCNEFINNMLDAHPDGFVTGLFKAYTGPTGDWMDYVGHTETLLEDLKEALQLAGQPIVKPFDQLAPRNVSSSLPWISHKLLVKTETVQRVERIESWVLDTFYQKKEEE